MLRGTWKKHSVVTKKEALLEREGGTPLTFLKKIQSFFIIYFQLKNPLVKEQ